MLSRNEIFNFTPDEKYKKQVAYFSMEFAIDASLKIFSGGLGFLAGSHMRSAYQLKQNLVGVGMLWKYGYYDQERNFDGTMKPVFSEKKYDFLTDTGIIFQVPIHSSNVHVKAFLLKPDVFGSAPVFLLTTDLPQNDYISQAITHKLYDSNEATRIAQSIILGVGGAMLMDLLSLDVEIYHMNEGHSLPLNFYLYSKYKNLDEVKKRVVFTTHTPEKAGNEEHHFGLLEQKRFFYTCDPSDIRNNVLKIQGDSLDYTLSALKFAKKANGVSKLHGEVSNQMWNNKEGVCQIVSVTNAQDKKYWSDNIMDITLDAGDDVALLARKKYLKNKLFQLVALQTGKIFDESVLTIVWARRFAGYKRADLLMRDYQRFLRLVNNTEHPVQIIWAGKPYPEDYQAIDTFNYLIRKTAPLANCTVLTGYELTNSALLKKGSDVWLNNPKMYREASGTSGMTAAMNGSINLSIPDGWVPEFAKDGVNSFLISQADKNLSIEQQDDTEYESLMKVLQETIIPIYYNDKPRWNRIMKQGMKDVVPMFDSQRMATEYYDKMYS